jgi:hypothetical protein
MYWKGKTYVPLLSLRQLVYPMAGAESEMGLKHIHYSPALGASIYPVTKPHGT